MALIHDRVRARLTAPGQLFEMDEIEVRGTRLRTWKHAPLDFRALLAAGRGHGERDFIVYRDERMTFERHYARAAALAGRLARDLGVAKGERVALAMRNYPEWVVCFSAILARGAVAVPLNAWWSAPELEYGLADSGAKVVIADGERATRLGRVRHSARLVVTRPDGEQPAGAVPLEELIGDGDPDAMPDVVLDPEDPATIFYTSGTTGRPKGALGTHRNLAQGPMSTIYSLVRGSALAGRDPQTILGRRRVSLLTVPLFHVTGSVATVVTSLFSGATVVLMYRWDPEEALGLIERERITGLVGVPTNAWQLTAHPDLPRRDLSSLTSLGYGGAPAPPRLVERIGERLPGRSASNGYGMTETSGLVIGNSGPDYLRHPDSIGLPVAVLDVRITGPDGGELATGEVGELCLRGPGVIAGYWNSPEATAQTFVDGWLHTGDLARVDEDGLVYVVDRATDMVIRGGENVYCAEVEAALFDHPGVQDAAVIGVPHEELGEEVGAVIRPVPGGAVTPAELAAFLKERIAPFKIPSRYWFRAGELPRNPGGKILKTLLRRQVIGS